MPTDHPAELYLILVSFFFFLFYLLLLVLEFLDSVDKRILSFSFVENPLSMLLISSTYVRKHCPRSSPNFENECCQRPVCSCAVCTFWHGFVRSFIHSTAFELNRWKALIRIGQMKERRVTKKKKTEKKLPKKIRILYIYLRVRVRARVLSSRLRWLYAVHVKHISAVCFVSFVSWPRKHKRYFTKSTIHFS